MIGCKLNGALRGARQHLPRVRQKRAVGDYRRGITQHLEIVRAGRGGLSSAVGYLQTGRHTWRSAGSQPAA